jgi:integral membrane protein
LSSIKNLRLVALAEATTFLALLVATYFKVGENTAGGKTAVSILGPIHGVIFLAYVFITIMVRAEQRWTARTTLLILIGAVIPFGGYYVDWWLRKNAG